MNIYGSGVNDVTVKNGIVAVASEIVNENGNDDEDDDFQDNGKVIFFDVDGNFLNEVQVGSLPDMLTFTPNGKMVLVACEGEPASDYSTDPEGTVAIVDVTNSVANATVNIVNFQSFNNAVLEPGIRIFGPGASVAQDLEPEYVAISPDENTAYVALQENNALAVIDLSTQSVVALKALGFKNHNMMGNALDASDKDSGINIANWPVFGMYQPDAIATYSVNGKTYIVTANEGDARDYEAIEEEERVKDLDLDPNTFPNALTLQQDANIGRLTVTNTLGDTDNDEDFDNLYVFGGRSFSIWDANASLVFDSGDDFEQITAMQLPSSDSRFGFLTI